MIRDWRYDDGQPTWSDAINDYVGEPRKPSWHCVIYDRHISCKIVREWLETNLVKDEQYDETIRFNSGDVAMFLHLYDKDAAATFRLVWG